MYRGEIKGFGNLLNVNFVRKKIDSPREHYTSFLLGTGKCCYLLGKLRKHIELVTFFVYLNDEIPAIFSNWEPGAQPKLRMLYTFFRWEGCWRMVSGPVSHTRALGPTNEKAGSYMGDKLVV